MKIFQHFLQFIKFAIQICIIIFCIFGVYELLLYDIHYYDNTPEDIAQIKSILQEYQDTGILDISKYNIEVVSKDNFIQLQNATYEATIALGQNRNLLNVKYSIKEKPIFYIYSFICILILALYCCATVIYEKCKNFHMCIKSRIEKILTLYKLS